MEGIGSYLEGRVKGRISLEDGTVIADELIFDGEDQVEKHRESGDIEQAMFWCGMATEARVWLLQHADRAMRHEHAEYEVCEIVISNEEGGRYTESFWCERSKTAEILPQVMATIRGVILSVVIRPAFWEEIGTSYLTDYERKSA